MIIKDKVKYLDIALRIQGIQLSESILKVIAETYEVILKKDGKTNLTDIAKIKEESNIKKEKMLC